MAAAKSNASAGSAAVSAQRRQRRRRSRSRGERLGCGKGGPLSGLERSLEPHRTTNFELGSCRSRATSRSCRRTLLRPTPPSTANFWRPTSHFVLTVPRRARVREHDRVETAFRCRRTAAATGRSSTRPAQARSGRRAPSRARGRAGRPRRRRRTGAGAAGRPAASRPRRRAQLQRERRRAGRCCLQVRERARVKSKSPPPRRRCALEFDPVVVGPRASSRGARQPLEPDQHAVRLAFVDRGLSRSARSVRNHDRTWFAVGSER